MTQKELHRLGRRDVLQLLLSQSEEFEQTKQQLKETQDALEVAQANYEKLRKRLDHKDEQIHKLREALDQEKTKREIELVEAGSIAEAALRLNGIFEAAQKAADQYLYNLTLPLAERMKREGEDDSLQEPEDTEEVKTVEEARKILQEAKEAEEARMAQLQSETGAQDNTQGTTAAAQGTEKADQNGAQGSDTAAQGSVTADQGSGTSAQAEDSESSQDPKKRKEKKGFFRRSKRKKEQELTDSSN